MLSANMRRKSARCFADLKCVGDNYLLWFHHLPWTYRMASGRSLWGELIARYDRGLATVGAIRAQWQALRPFVDAGRYAGVTSKLDRQYVEAKWWRDASLAYFRSVAHLPLPAGSAPPPHDLSWYRAIHFDMVPGFLTPGTGHQLSCVPPEGGPPCAL